MAALCVLAAAAWPAAQPAPIDRFFEQLTSDWMRLHPDLAASSGYFTGAEQTQVERDLTPHTIAHRRARVTLARRGRDELRAFDRDALTPLQRESADLLQWQLDDVLRGERYLDLEYPLEQMQGANVGLVNTLTVRHTLRTEADARNYLARLELVGTRMREAIAEARRIEALGTVPPRFILDATIRQMEEFVSGGAARNPLVVTFDERLRAGNVVPDARRATLRADAERIVTSDVAPAWREGIALLRSQLPRATSEAGLSRLPGGAEAYAHLLRRYTTTSLGATQIHEIGRGEVARLEQEMDGLLRSLGRTDGTVASRVERLTRDLAYPETPAGRSRLMADIDEILADARTRSARLFSRVPNAAVVAQPYPEFRWASAAASYTPPPLDGSRPGIFQMPLRPERLTRFGLRSLVYHETVPGHHFQIALTNEHRSLPRFRQIRAFGGISAITEGWALYAERLAAEEGWYEGDPEGRIGQLEMALWRARRLVVDTGLHTMGWSRQQAIDYGIEPSEVDRYVVMPGQATSYMIGALRIVELRERARAALGPRFSLREFHDAVLDAGIVPLEMLETRVQAYIQAQR